MDDFIAKPFDMDVLYGSVLKWLSRGRAARAVQTERAATSAPLAPGGALAALADHAGLDLQRGLSLFGGDTATYVSILRLLAARHHGDVECLRTEWTEGQTDKALRRTDALKGAAANLGVKGLANAAAGVESALRQRQRVGDGAALLERLHAEMTAL